MGCDTFQTTINSQYELSVLEKVIYLKKTNEGKKTSTVTLCMMLMKQMPIYGVNQSDIKSPFGDRAHTASIYIKLKMDVYQLHNLFKYWTDSREI